VRPPTGGLLRFWWSPMLVRKETSENKCAVCGGTLVPLVDVVVHPVPHQKGQPRTIYFRCDSCAQIKIIEE